METVTDNAGNILGVFEERCSRSLHEAEVCVVTRFGRESVCVPCYQALYHDGCLFPLWALAPVLHICRTTEQDRNVPGKVWHNTLVGFVNDKEKATAFLLACASHFRGPDSGYIGKSSSHHDECAFSYSVLIQTAEALTCEFIERIQEEAEQETLAREAARLWTLSGLAREEAWREKANPGLANSAKRAAAAL